MGSSNFYKGIAVFILLSSMISFYKISYKRTERTLNNKDIIRNKSIWDKLRRSEKDKEKSKHSDKKVDKDGYTYVDEDTIGSDEIVCEDDNYENGAYINRRFLAKRNGALYRKKFFAKY